MKEKIYHVIISIFLFIVGILIIGNAFSIWKFNVFFKGWWALFIIIPALESFLFQNGKSASFYALLLGVGIILYNQEIINFDILWKTLLACFIVLIAINLFISIFRKDKVVKARNRSVPLYVGIFGEADEKVINDNFEGCTCISLFGSVDLDLSDLKLKDDIYIKTKSIFGGVDIFLPEGVNVITSGTSILGGTENKVKKSSSKEKKKVVNVYIESFCLFGGAEIK